MGKICGQCAFLKSKKKKSKFIDKNLNAVGYFCYLSGVQVPYTMAICQYYEENIDEAGRIAPKTDE